MTPWVDIASIAKINRRQEGYVVKSAKGLPFLLRKGMKVWLVPPQTDAPRHVAVSHVKPTDEAGAVVRFEEVADPADYPCLVGCHILAKRADFSEEELAPSDEQDFVGWILHDKKTGEVGIIAEVIDRASQPLLVIKKDDREILVPLAEELIEKVNGDAHILEMDLPLGLLEL
ncbi:MAG: hypothetical protein LUB61_03230 [Eggerthellaceae bacterium]|nr:hypothetical protein [Eggerthellaceae bacterium]